MATLGLAFHAGLLPVLSACMMPLTPLCSGRRRQSTGRQGDACRQPRDLLRRHRPICRDHRLSPRLDGESSDASMRSSWCSSHRPGRARRTGPARHQLQPGPQLCGAEVRRHFDDPRRLNPCASNQFANVRVTVVGGQNWRKAWSRSWSPSCPIVGTMYSRKR